MEWELLLLGVGSDLQLTLVYHGSPLLLGANFAAIEAEKRAAVIDCC